MKGKTKYKDMSELPEWVREKLYSLRCKLYEPPMTLDEYFRSKDYETILVDDILYYTDTPRAKKIVGEYKTMEDNHGWLKDTLLTAVIKNGMVVKNRYGLFENSFTAWVDSLYNDKRANTIYCTKETVKEIDNAILDEVGGERLKKLKIALWGYLPYGLFVKEKTSEEPVIYDIDYHPNWRTCKPYLRSMSSMAEEEKETYQMFFNEDALLNTSVETYLDWLLEGRFDYRGLIAKGLALEAPKGMYVKKEEEK